MVHGERSLEVLLRTIQPRLREGTWAFVLLRHGEALPADAVAVFREDEGSTAVVTREAAERLSHDPLFLAAWITLEVQSDLYAVGFLAAVTRALAAAGISCNVFSAVYHDHLFVPADRGAEAVEILRGLAES